MKIPVEYIPALVNLDTSKSGNVISKLLSVIYSSGSDISLILAVLLPLPLAAMFIQKRFKTQGSVDHNPEVWGLRHDEINGRRTPICKVINGLYFNSNNSWYL